MMHFKTAIAALAMFPGVAAMAEPDLDAGRAIFNETAAPPCGVCHALADAGAEGAVGPDLDEFAPSFEQVRAAVTSGIGVMPAFEETMTPEQIDTVATYVAAVTGGGAAQEGGDDSDLPETAETDEAS
ncbi:SorU family sulfite dehydrogenase c-type cytochrome subunit [Limimaricola sp.]|uniref:SorU family sulfite dehydrogenase c-type cytochrome subunit n=1 Tax=Limimaricola sp. TaxID=2211665 RepID=UPI0040587D76